MQRVETCVIRRRLHSSTSNIPCLQAALTLADADTAAHAAALLALENSARASVAAIPVVPSTSSYISVSDRPAPQTLLASVEDVFGSVCLEPRDPDIHVHTPHCTHAGFVASPNAFLAAFTAHPGNARSFVSLGLSEGDSASLIGSAALKQLHDEILRRFSNQLKSMVVPISCLLPSQLIALSLMSRLAGTQDVLMRLGEGQGKSIVLALAAAAALKAARSPQRVIVFTSSDHLALRDHAFASKFFAAEALESIAITHDSSSLVGFQTARVIYANALAVDRLLSDLIMDFNEGEFLGPDQAAFVNVFFSIEESSYAVILDEFDLLLDDLVKQLPKVKRIPTYILSRADAEHPSQDIIPELRTDEHDSLRWICADEAEAFVDPLTGVTCSKVYTMMYSEGNERAGWFHLAPSVFRLSQFLERAESVKGLSGSTNDDSTYVLGRRNWGSTIPFFALPSWHDPTVFDTEIIPSGFESEIAIKSGSVGNDVRNRSVWCQTRRVINRPEDRIIPMDPTTGLPFIGKVFLEDISLPTLAEVDIWAQQIVSDIIVTSHRGPKRPVLVFAPSANKLFRSGPPVVAGRSPPVRTTTSK